MLWDTQQDICLQVYQPLFEQHDLEVGNLWGRVSPQQGLRVFFSTACHLKEEKITSKGKTGDCYQDSGTGQDFPGIQGMME